MKRLLSSFLLLISLSTQAGMPPATVKNDQGTSSGSTITVVPNNQGTSLGGIQTRIETGNSNLLVNPSFEHSTLNFGWTVTTGTPASEGTIVTEGKKSLKITSTVSGMRTSQVSTINAAYLKGQQMVAMVKVNTNDPLTQVCAIVDSVDTNCTTVNVTSSASPFIFVQIPFIGGGTNNGIVIKSATATAGLITYLDDVKVGTDLPFQNVNGAQLVGTVKITGCTANWTVTSTTLASFTAQTSCAYATTGSAVSDTTFGTTQLPAIKFSSLLAGDYIISYEGSLYSGTSGANVLAQFSDGTNSTREQVQQVLGTGGGGLVSTTQSISYTSTQSNVTLQLKAASSSGAVNLTGTTANPSVIKVWYFPPASRIYSTASQDYAYTNAGTITIGATTTAPTKGTIVTDRIMASRKGQNLIAEYQYEQSSAGTAGSGEYLYTLPSGLSFDTNIIIPFNGAIYSSAQAHSKSIIGYGNVSDGPATTNFCKLLAYSSTQFRAWCINNSSNGAAAGAWANGSASFPMSSATYALGFRLQAPIQGWQDYGVIVGSFQYVPQINGTNNAKFFGGTLTTTSGVLSTNYGGVVTSCTAANGSVCALSGLTASPMFCTANCSNNATGCSVGISAKSSTSITFTSFTSNTGAALASQAIDFSCLGF